MTTRRVVTGINEDGKSCVIHDGPTPGVLDLGRAINHEIWVDDPADPGPDAARAPVADGRFVLEPPRGGSVLRVFTFLPAGRSDGPTEDAIAEALTRWETGDAMEPDNPGWHATRTIDYGIVLSGEIELELDERSVRLGPGDVVVQRGTRHAWRLPGDEPCTMAFVLISSPNYQ